MTGTMMTPTKSDLVTSALFDFAGYLTVLPVIEVGDTADATSLLERLSQFLANRNLSASSEVQLPIENWQEFLD